MVFNHVSNPHVEELSADVMYHLGLTYDKAERDKIASLFGDVKFFITGGSNDRMTAFATTTAKELGIETPYGYAISPIGSTARYKIYKVGPVLIASHGMGQPSVSILLHEVTKLLEYAGAKDAVYMRMGTSGGVGVEPGTVVITSEGVNNQMEAVHAVEVLDRTVLRASVCSTDVVEGLAQAAQQLAFEHAVGKTLTCDDFYEGQGRLDGAICEYSLQDKMNFLQKASDAGVRNIEMEARGFAAFCHRLNISVGVACVALLNRLNGDQVTSPHETLVGYEERPARIMLRFVKNRLGLP
jgi:uridine phosphorylase